MERRHIKRLPVIRDGRMVGIVSRANLMHALASLSRSAPAPAGGDAAIRDASSPHWASSTGRRTSMSSSKMASPSCGACHR